MQLALHDGMMACYDQVMSAGTIHAEIKVVGKSGQISLGKRYAGKTLRVERRADGSVVLTAVAVIPESQHWTLQEPHRSQIERGLAWAAETDPSDAGSERLLTPPPTVSLKAKGTRRTRARHAS